MDDASSRADRIEAGRRMFARSWQFVLGVDSAERMPLAEGVEIALAGRSNVGKSTLLNALTGQKALARTSNTPGRTQQLNFFSAGTGPTIVDLPGYGYAEAPKARVAAWTRLVFAFLQGRPNLRRVYLLLDARHGIKTADNDTLDLLDRAAVSYQIVLTKSDKAKPDDLDTVVRDVAGAIAKRPAAYPEVLATSARTGLGIDELRAGIAALTR